MLTVLFIGDVVGYVGLEMLLRMMPHLKDNHKPDCIIVNGENITDGKGMSDKEAAMLFKAGVHVITTGNHIWENWRARNLLATQKHVLRPHNYPAENPGTGITVCALPPDGKRKVAVIQIQGRVYMQSIDCPFKCVDAAVETVRKETDIVIVDFHAEATGEKIAMGKYLDGRVSALLGTHTHVQTADAEVLPGGTAYITDVGMTGPIDSVLGMKTDTALKRFLLQTAHKYETADGAVRICGVVVKIDEFDGKAVSIESLMYPQMQRNRDV